VGSPQACVFRAPRTDELDLFNVTTTMHWLCKFMGAAFQSTTVAPRFEA
jgi:hypothetical protein